LRRLAELWRRLVLRCLMELRCRVVLWRLAELRCGMVLRRLAVHPVRMEVTRGIASAPIVLMRLLLELRP
jgi:hypothetical protein